MIKYLSTLFLLLSVLLVTAQEVVSTQGDSYSNASARMDFTVGEVIINTGTSGTNDITQGFHQSNWNFSGLEDFAPEYEVSVFPNPSDEVLNIKTNLFEEVSYSLYDAQGKLLIQKQLFTELTSVEVGHLAPGSYSLVLNKDSRILKSFKLIKQN